MAHTSKLHDVEIMVGRSMLTVLVGLGLTAFVLLAAAATVYDIGRWISIW